jgi:hypothetical protein
VGDVRKAVNSIAITDEGHGAVSMDVGGEVDAGDPEIAE